MQKFSNKQKLNKTNIAKVPEDKAIVYKIKSENGKNLYTGIAGRGRGQDRLLEHKEVDGEKIPGGQCFSFAQVKNKEEAKKLEKKIIREERPKYNEQGE